MQVNVDMMLKRYFEYCDFVFVSFFSDWSLMMNFFSLRYITFDAKERCKWNAFCLFAFQALDALIELSSSTFEQSRNDSYLNNSVNYKEDIRFLIERKDSVSYVILFLDYVLVVLA